MVEMNTVAIVGIICLILILVYGYLIMPRLFGRPDASLFDKVLFAHRGLHDNAGDAPENSLRAFQKAVDAGYGIELDVHLSKDGIPVVHHDFVLSRVAHEAGCVEDYTLEELQKFRLADSDQTIPTLREVLELVDGRVPLIIEYKSESKDVSVCPVSNELLKNYRGAYCVESFNPFAMRWYKFNRPDVVRGQLSDGFLHYPEFRTKKKAFLSFCLQFMLTNVLSRPDFIAYNHLYEKNLSRKICCGLYGAKAAAWTIKSEAQLKKAEPHFDVFIFDSFIPSSTPKV